MATKANSNNGPHSAGIFADMTVDGPEIGTLVLIIDRAKNLPNRKSMGKQSCYAAARLGKEARKTDTDKRGGQTPKWDQELRFTVHDSPDYYTLKISVFSEDKRTDLIGEAYINLTEVIVPGGGKSDIWQGLNCKGRYSGELRVEMTYYDTRQKPEKALEVVSVAEELRQQYGSVGAKVKRRPLPSNPNAPSTTPVIIPDRAIPGRAKHGPRDYSSPARAQSLPLEALSYPYSANSLVGHSPSPAPPPGHASFEEQEPPAQYYGEYDENQELQPYDPHHQAVSQQPDFLPTLPPSQRQRESLPVQPSYPARQSQQHRPPPQPQTYAPLPHAHSAPIVPVTHSQPHEYVDGEHEYHGGYPEPLQHGNYQHPQVRARRNSAQPEWQNGYEHHMHAEMPPHADDNIAAPPPPPPMHSHSSPAVPHYTSPVHAHPPQNTPSRYATAPPGARQQFIPSPSPLQSTDGEYGNYQMPPSHSHPSRGHSFEDYNASPIYSSPPAARSYDSIPNQAIPTHGRAPPRPMTNRLSMADPYSTSPRPHPLSQEVPRPASRNHYVQELPGSAANEQRMYHQPDYGSRNVAPTARPRPISPAPPHAPSSAPPSSRAKSTYSIQFPVRSFESSAENPLSHSQQQANTPPRGPVPRKSVSPRPSISGSPSVPYSPDSFGVHNPNTPQSTERAPILDWNGREVDPSDHLPVHSWAPEPEKKTPSKTYGLGRDRDFGPRAAQPGSGGRLSKDTMINVRIKDRGSPAPTNPPQQQMGGYSEPAARNRLTKRSGPPASRGSMIEMPLRDHANFNPVPNPYEQHQQQYPHGYGDSSPGPDYGPPSLPPKVPMDHGRPPGPYHQPQYEYGYEGPDALSREISNIDLGPGRNSRSSGGPAFVPVRSHRDRNSFY